jgi:predicted RNase H-like nuclease (RuvC/YqgF family)
MIKWFRTNIRLRKDLKKKQEEINNLRNDWFEKRKEISELKRELQLARRMWDETDKTKRY